MAAQNVQDTGIVFKPVYTKKEFKKESHDLKAYDKVVKEFRKSNAGTNIDLKNASLETLRETMKKEYDELNTRITARAKNLILLPLKLQQIQLLSRTCPRPIIPPSKTRFLV